MADDTVRGPRRRRTVVVAVAVWLAVVVAASALAWFAIGRAGSEVLGPTAQQVPTSTSSAPAPTPATTSPPATGTATTPAPTTDPTADPSTASTTGTTTVPPATAVDEVTTVAGGQAGFRCTGEALTLRFAQPATGWSVRQEAEDGEIRVEFESGSGRFRIQAVCSGGEPSVAVESDADGGDDGGGGGGDDD